MEDNHPKVTFHRRQIRTKDLYWKATSDRRGAASEDELPPKMAPIGMIGKTFKR
jgi:hypothetical protein